METTTQGRDSSGGAFCTTHWSLVVDAAQTDFTSARTALEQLCRAYWFPLYAYVRRSGHNAEEAQDLTQEFFLRLLQKQYLRSADSSRGRFRTFLLTCLKHFMVNEWVKANRQKRGGGCSFISLDVDETENRLMAEPTDGSSPDKAFDRRWALVLLDRTMEHLQAEFGDNGRTHIFEELKPFLTGEENQSSYAEVGQKLGMTQANTKVTVHRMRRRYRDLLRGEIARTVNDPQAVEDEMRELLQALLP